MAEKKANKNVKVFDIHVKEIQRKDGSGSFLAYYTITSSGKKIDVKFRKGCMTPVQYSKVTVPIDEYNIDKTKRFWCYWIHKVDKIEPVEGVAAYDEDDEPMFEQ